MLPRSGAGLPPRRGGSRERGAVTRRARGLSWLVALLCLATSPLIAVPFLLAAEQRLRDLRVVARAFGRLSCPVTSSACRCSRADGPARAAAPGRHASRRRAAAEPGLRAGDAAAALRARRALHRAHSVAGPRALRRLHPGPGPGAPASSSRPHLLRGAGVPGLQRGAPGSTPPRGRRPSRYEAAALLAIFARTRPRPPLAAPRGAGSLAGAPSRSGWASALRGSGAAFTRRHGPHGLDAGASRWRRCAEGGLSVAVGDAPGPDLRSSCLSRRCRRRSGHGRRAPFPRGRGAARHTSR
jgi:hypothetical protein